MSISYIEQLRTLADGHAVSLRQPTYSITTPYMPLPGGLLISARVAPPVFGLGLLESVAEADIVALADENDANGDGISGRPNHVWDVAAQATRLGRALTEAIMWHGGEAGASALVVQQMCTADRIKLLVFLKSL